MIEKKPIISRLLKLILQINRLICIKIKNPIKYFDQHRFSI
jgi:hypothetical protein